MKLNGEKGEGVISRDKDTDGDAAIFNNLLVHADLPDEPDS